MGYSDTFYDMLQVLNQSYKKFPKFMIEIMAEKYDIPLEKIKPLFIKFRKIGILLIIRDEGYTFRLNNA